MKKRLFIISFSLLFFFLNTTPVLAATICPGNEFTNLCSISIEEDSNIIGKVFNLLLVTSVLLSVLFLIWGGIKWIMSNGDKGKLDGARGTIIASIVGLVISFLAFFIINTVTYVFGVDGAKSLQIPRLVSAK